jgi:C1A family cysteine protease
MPRKIKGYGWVPDLPDGRDLLYGAPIVALGELPTKVDLRPQCPPVYDQGQLGSCTANAIAAALEFDQMREKAKKPFVPSRLFIYFNERAIEGTVKSDSGAQIRDGVKSVAQQGACKEEKWPYDIGAFAQKPSPQCYAEGVKNQAILYLRVGQSLSQMKGCLAEGFPFVFGFTVYESFESAEVAKTGHAGMPRAKESVLGGHAVLAVGYDEKNQWFIVRNSWGKKWGMSGYFTLPYPYLLQSSLASDFWTIRSVEVEASSASRRGRKAAAKRR